jgi:hypothetical protein
LREDAERFFSLTPAADGRSDDRSDQCGVRWPPAPAFETATCLLTQGQSRRCVQ